MLRQAALAAIQQSCLAEKLRQTLAIDLALPVDPQAELVPTRIVPGREARPELVPAAQLASRGTHHPEGRAALIHALAHIELNAVDLALDIAWRFSGLPEDFYRDWVRIAQEEAYHFSLLKEHLASYGFAYGDFPAHGGLWDMAEKTRDDVLARLALVPRTLEARGLDVNPAIRHKLNQAGDKAAAAILDIILRDEIGHVAAGNRWYHYCCEQRGMDPLTAHAELAEHYAAPRQRGPYNIEARRAAGFSELELSRLSL
ncbi:ferritin-like domain-containing protein [Chitinilyticum piscinae]|uniref:Ferritin-like domain-containing protein n=1 Tax=Chitinilyticum piscinae TaxID=2866724 RepID=A0A8J7KEX0_9NEIS|nr:ferritin-like domain-containing protein [Chitinilyticum piscinae]MBE9609834.1 ferritin-like domain-containing protein [Chitinilyticum piscinae]